MPAPRAAAILVSLLAALAAGCADPTTDIAVRDNGVFLPAGRMSIDISPEAKNPAVPHTGHGLELGLSAARGSDHQQLRSGEAPVVFGGSTFNAPVVLEHEFRFLFAEAAYRFRKFFGSSQKFGIEALAGVAHAELDLKVSSPAQSAREDVDSGGLVGGFGLVWKFRPSTSIQSRLAVFGSGDEGGVSTARRVDIYLAQAIGPHAALRAGYANWNVDSDREFDDATRSPIRARFSGFALGLDVMF